MNNEMISTEEFAKLLGVKPQTIRAAVCREKSYYGITPTKLPNRFLRWRRSDVDSILSGGKS